MLLDCIKGKFVGFMMLKMGEGKVLRNIINIIKHYYYISENFNKYCCLNSFPSPPSFKVQNFPKHKGDKTS